jgi:large conductance mechanosensitive channel
MKIIQEFKAFAIKGNVADMAVGVIIGGAFGKIVTSLINDIIMPPLGMLIGGVNFKELKFILKEASGEQVAVSLNYGSFIQTSLDFIILAASVFIMIKILNSLKRKEEIQPSTPPLPNKQEELLSEIRDLLKLKN